MGDEPNVCDVNGKDGFQVKDKDGPSTRNKKR